MLVRLLYVSRTQAEISAAEADAILEQSRTYNRDHGITGVLCWSGRMYLQVIEGGREPVNVLYTKIVRDKRHDAVTLLEYAEIDERRFSNWTMGRVNMARVNPDLLLRYSERPVMDPYAVSGKVSLALLEELLLSAAVV